MAHPTEIEVHCIGSSHLHESAVWDWLRRFGVDADSTGVFNLNAVGTQLAGLAGKRCYLSFQPGINPNVTAIRSDWTKYIDNILESEHGSVLEHVTYTWAIEGVTRVFTGELNRHRAGCAISEGSMRYIRYEDIPYWEPPGLSDSEKEIFRETFEFVERQIQKLYAIWNIDAIKDFATKKILTSRARRLLPMGTATGGVWTFNLRALRHILTMRCSQAAEEEICFVFSHIAKMMLSYEPEIFGDFEQDASGFWRPKYRKV